MFAGAVAGSIAPVSLLAFMPQMEFYEVGGQTVFPFYGVSGGIATKSVCYPMIRFGKTIYLYCHEARLADYAQRRLNPFDVEQIHKDAKAAFAFNWGKPTVSVDLNGGDLPFHDGVIGEYTLNGK